MKNFKIFITLTILSSFSLTAQNSDTKKADRHFERLEFVEAAEEYAELVEDGKGDQYVYSRLAESYYNIFNTKEAERFYYQALENDPNPDPEMVYKYSLMLKANGKYDLSNQQMQRFAKLKPSDKRAIAFMEEPNYIPKILERGKKFFIKLMPFNSGNSDFGGTVLENKLYITSARENSGQNYGWNDEPYLDIYELTKNEDGTFGEVKALSSKINTQYHEGLVSFSPDGKTMYFSRESFFEKSFQKDSITKNKNGVIHLFKATKLGDDDKWDNVEGFPMNNKTYSVKNPSVSKDGKTLYFASDMPGTVGLFDIYKAEIREDGSLGQPVNLGGEVNTEGQEMFPYISDNNTLYFSSNGHLGLGGLDVFFTKEIDGQFTPVRNIGVPINGNFDDFAFRINEETKEGYVSTNRPGGAGSDDIYEIKRLQPLFDVTVIATVTDDETREPLADATVTLFDDKGNKLLSKQTNADGVAEFLIETGQDAELEVVIDGYETRRVAVEATEKEEVSVSIAMSPIDELIVDGAVVLDPIYFDYDKSNITDKAAYVLDNLLQVMKKYPDMVIYATSHTDSRGSDAYNEKLSDRRAKTTVQYIISKGIDKSRITGEGKGEKEPFVDCGANCTEEEHQLNRRSEFKIMSGGPQQAETPEN